MPFYNHTIFTFPAGGADTLVLKRVNCPPVVIEALDDSGDFRVDASDFVAGDYHYQTLAGGNVTASGKLTILQNLAHAAEDFDPRSVAEITIDAIDSMLAGRATAQQRKIQVGDKSIEYSSLDELKKWRAFFVNQLRKEQGKKPFTRQLFKLGRG